MHGIITGLGALVLTYLTYESFQVTYDFGISRILMVLLDIGFILAMISTFSSISIKHFVFWLFLPIFCFFMFFGVDIPAFIRIIFAMLYVYTGLKLYKLK